MSSSSSDLWKEIFLVLTPEEKELCHKAPILLKCSEKDSDIVGSLVWSHFVNNDEWNGTFRYTGGVIASIFNKRFAKELYTYMDFYCSNLRFVHHDKNRRVRSTYMIHLRKMEKKYDAKVCINCSK